MLDYLDKIMTHRVKMQAR